jgi:hypothetical protein
MIKRPATSARALKDTTHHQTEGEGDDENDEIRHSLPSTDEPSLRRALRRARASHPAPLLEPRYRHSFAFAAAACKGVVGAPITS